MSKLVIVQIGDEIEEQLLTENLVEPRKMCFFIYQLTN